MNKVHVLSGIACASVLLVTGALAEIQGVQPGTSDNPKDNVPKEIQRSTLGDAAYPKGSSGPGTRSDALVDMKKEKPEPVTQQQLEQNVEKTHEGRAAVAAEELKENSQDTSKQAMRSKEDGGTADGSDTGSAGGKTERQMFRQQNSDPAAQGQELINKQPTDKQQPANRPASEGGTSQK
ncbi:MAG TPA: hypothetical protein VLC51_11665 [Nitrospira sp.]|nr:hypothetical protein [Nitrospira sp.]